MVCILHVEPYHVEARLRSLNLTFEECMEAFEAMVAAANGCTENDPPAAAGWDAWRYGVRRWREIKRPQGWAKNDAENISTIVHPEAKFRIAVTNTDEATGLVECEPRSRSAKGDGSRRAVELNRSPPLPLPEFVEDFNQQLLAAAAAAAHIWYFCGYIEGDVRRLELSKPRAIDAGHFTGWDERIILVDRNGPVCDRPLSDDSSGSDIEVVVRRRG